MQSLFQKFTFSYAFFIFYKNNAVYLDSRFNRNLEPLNEEQKLKITHYSF